MDTKKSLALGNYNLYTDDLSMIDLDHHAIINTLNPHSFYIAENDTTFRKALENADILLPDGIGIVWAARFLKRENIHRISGMDVYQHLLRIAAAKPDMSKRKIFFLGSSRETLDKIEQRIRQEYPTLQVGSFSPPYKDIYSEEDNESILQEIRKFRPHLMFVGMTAPRQEKWVYKNKDRIQATVICSIGAVFDFYAGTVKRPSDFWISFGLEWFVRFMREPKRLWKRNLISAPYFIYRIVKYKLQTIGKVL